MDNTQNKTAEGKEISKYNAIRHGVLTKVLLPEETSEAQTIKDQLTSEYKPRNLTEELLIETMAVAYMRRQRAINAEREYMLQVLNPPVWEEQVTTAPLIENPANPSAQMFGEKKLVVLSEGYQAKFPTSRLEG